MMRYPDVLLNDGNEETQLLKQKLKEEGFSRAHTLQEGRHDLWEEWDALETQ